MQKRHSRIHTAPIGRWSQTSRVEEESTGEDDAHRRVGQRDGRRLDDGVLRVGRAGRDVDHHWRRRSGEEEEIAQCRHRVARVLVDHRAHQHAARRGICCLRRPTRRQQQQQQQRVYTPHRLVRRTTAARAPAIRRHWNCTHTKVATRPKLLLLTSPVVFVPKMVSLKVQTVARIRPELRAFLYQKKTSGSASAYANFPATSLPEPRYGSLSRVVTATAHCSCRLFRSKLFQVWNDRERERERERDKGSPSPSTSATPRRGWAHVNP